MAENNIVTFRTTDLERSMLDYLISKGHKQSDVIKAGIREVYQQEVSKPATVPIAGTIKDGKVEFLVRKNRKPTDESVGVDWAAEIDK